MIDRAAAQAAAAGLTADVRPHLKKFESKIEMDKSGAVGTPAWYGAVHFAFIVRQFAPLSPIADFAWDRFCI